MNVIKQSLVLLFFLNSISNAYAYLDKDGIPQKGFFGFRGILYTLKCCATFDFAREKRMLEAFENHLKSANQEDLTTFKESFIPEDCGRHPELIKKAIEHNQAEILLFMQEKGLNVKRTYDEYCFALAEQKTYALHYPLHARIQTDGDKALTVLSVLIALGFDSQQKDGRGNTLQHIAVEKKALKVLLDLKNDTNAGEVNNDGKTLLHIAASMRPPSEGEALYTALLQTSNFNPYIPDVQGKRVLDINDEQEEYYCNPPQDGQLLEPSELEKRLKERHVIQKRKADTVKRLDSMYIEEYAKKLKMLNAEEEKSLKEEVELIKQLREEEEKKVKEALEKKATLEEKEAELSNQQEIFRQKKDESLDKVKELLGQKK